MTTDRLDITYGDYIGRPQILMALRDAVPLLAAYPGPGELPAALTRCMGCATSTEDWESLAAAYKSGLRAVGISWQPPTYRQAVRYESHLAADQERLWWLRQILIRTGQADDATSWKREKSRSRFSRWMRWRVPG